MHNMTSVAMYSASVYKNSSYHVLLASLGGIMKSIDATPGKAYQL